MATTVSQGKINQDVAVMLERLSGRMDAAEARLKDLEDQRQRESDRDVQRLDKQPDMMRAIFGTYGGCVGQFLTVALSSLDFLIAVAALVITLTHH